MSFLKKIISFGKKEKPISPSPVPFEDPFAGMYPDNTKSTCAEIYNRPIPYTPYTPNPELKMKDIFDEQIHQQVEKIMRTGGYYE